MSWTRTSETRLRAMVALSPIVLTSVALWQKRFYKIMMLLIFCELDSGVACQI